MKCIRVAAGPTTHWAHEDVPGFMARMRCGQVDAEVVDWGTDPASRPELPAVAKAAPAMSDLPPRPHPWGAFKPGTWARRRVTFKGVSLSEATWDTTVVEVTDTHVTRRSETLGADGEIKTVEEKEPLALQGRRVGGLKVAIGAVEYPCLVVETPGEKGPTKTWLPLDGRAARLSVAFKVEGPETSSAVT